MMSKFVFFCIQILYILQSYNVILSLDDNDFQETSTTTSTTQNSNSDDILNTKSTNDTTDSFSDNVKKKTSRRHDERYARIYFNDSNILERVQRATEAPDKGTFQQWEICNDPRPPDKHGKDDEGLPIEKYPYLACIFTTMISGKNTTCTGTIISRRHILSAAYCVYDRPLKSWNIVDYTLVRVGSRYCYKDGIEISPVFFHVYDRWPNDLVAGILIIELAYDLYYCEKIQPIKLAPPCYGDTMIRMSCTRVKLLATFGYGFDPYLEDENKMAYLQALYAINLLPLDECEEDRLFRRVTQVCSQGSFKLLKSDLRRKHYIWPGDMGGPLVINSDINDDASGQPMQVGVVVGGAGEVEWNDVWSWTYKVVRYERVDILRGFIESVLFKVNRFMWQNKPCCPKSKAVQPPPVICVKSNSNSIKIYIFLHISLILWLIFFRLFRF